MPDRSRHLARTASPTEPTGAHDPRHPPRRAPRTLGGLLVCLTLPAALGLLVAALAAPVVLAAGVAGFCAGAVAAVVAARRVSVDAGPAGDTPPG